jgi:hypothetical protein
MDLDLPPYSFPGLHTDDANDEFMKVSGDEFIMKGKTNCGKPFD